MSEYVGHSSFPGAGTEGQKNLYIRMKSALTECQSEVGPNVVPRV